MTLIDNFKKNNATPGGKHSVVELELQSDARLIGELEVGSYKLMLVDFKHTGDQFELCLRYPNYYRDNERDGMLSWDQTGEEFAAIASLLLRKRIRYISIRRMDDAPRKHSFKGMDGNLIAPVLAAPNTNIATAKTNIEKVLKLETKLHEQFITASKMYHLAIELIEQKPEVAYLFLIFAVEAISNTMPFEKKPDELDSYSDVFKEIDSLAIPSETKLGIKQKIVKKQGFIKQRFVAFIKQNMPEDFWENAEGSTDWAKVKKDDLDKHLKNIYSLRCAFVHTGEPFNYYLTLPFRDGEILPSETVIIEGEKQSVIPSVKWFERLVSSVLVNHLEKISQ